MEFHPLAEAFPLMKGQVFTDLADDIRKQGLLEAISLYQGQILDGRNRYRACLEAGIEPHYEEYQGDDPLAFVLGKNLQRRHLNESQRAMVAARMANMRQGERTDLGPIGTMSQPEAAKSLNVSPRSVKRGKAVLESGTSELVAAVEQGQIAVSQAASIAKLEPETQQAVVEKIVEGVRPQEARRLVKAEEAVKGEQSSEEKYESQLLDVQYGDLWRAGRHLVTCGNCGDAAVLSRLLGDDKVNVLLNDPPYGKNLDTDYSKLPSTKAEGNRTYPPLLGDDKLFVYDTFGVQAAEEFWFGADYYRKSLPNGGSWLVWDKRVEEKFDAMIGGAFELIWSKRVHKREIIRCNNTLFSGEAEAKDKWHPTAKPTKVIAWILARYSRKSDIVADMYLGSGTTLIVCERMGRRCLGMELSSDYVSLILARYQAETGIVPELVWRADE